MAVIPSGQTPTQLVVNTGLSPAAVQLQIAAAIAAQAASDSATYVSLDQLDEFVPVSGPNIAATGDSLTAGTGGGGTSWPADLQTILTGAYSKPGTVTNLGVGGETSATIAGRVGLGDPWLATVAGGQIPASGPVTVTLQGSDGGTVAPLLQGNLGVNPVTIAGVPGTLTLSGGIYTFTRTTAGTAIPVSGLVPVTTAAATGNANDVHVLWWGTNDGPALTAQVVAREQATIRYLKALKKRWLVLGISNDTTANLAASDAAFAAAFGNRFLNIRLSLSSTAALAAEGISPTTADTAAIAAGAVPPSLRSDATHLNAAGYRRVARAVYTQLKALGWNDQWGTLGNDADVPPAPSNPTYVTSFNPASITAANPSVSVTAQVGDLLVAFAGTGAVSDTVAAPADGNGLTWTQRATTPQPQANGYAWTAVATQALTATTVAFGGAGGGAKWASVQVWRNTSGIGAIAAPAPQAAPDISLATSGAHSAVAVAVTDYNAVSGASRVWDVSAGAEVEGYYYTNPSAFTAYTAAYSDVGAAGAKTVGLTTPTGPPVVASVIAIELLAAS